MTIEDWKTYIKDTYDANIDYPWKEYPKYFVCRHTDNKKWFALFMAIPENKLGLEGEDMVNALNIIRPII